MPNKVKQFLEKIVKEKAPGPAATFSALHMLRAIELLAEKHVGRNKLAKELGIGEGAVRTLISRLKEAGLLSTSKTGCALTSRGLDFWRDYSKVFRKFSIETNELTHAKYNFAMLAKNCGHNVKSGMEQRDAAVKVGAEGATTIVLKNGQLMIPSVSDNLLRDFPNAAKQITGLMRLEENDVVVICGSDRLDLAEYGVLAAALTLIKDCHQ
ncbi:DUF4443 domain-containing protein [Candidatus Bathyarchaeota archaeon]|nr:DUF4443 domain-containing protein [Candidatus Bathyarchaeota archaeon]